MIILGDYHTHTIYSSGKHNSKHAKGTIYENALAAKQKGLKEIGITEHGLSHKLYGLQKKHIAKMRSEIEQAKQELGINILLGIEANIVSSNGDIDLTQEEIELFDYVIVGFHSFAKPKSFSQLFKFFIPNILGFKRKKDIERNTRALKLAMENNKINIISHPGVNFPIDFNEISKNDIETIVKNQTKLIVNSDAHSSSSVGEVNYPINFALKNEIPLELIVNINALPNFKK